MSTANKLLYLQDTKSAIKDAIVAKGVSIPVGTPFRNYATKISEISGGEGPTLPQADPYIRPTEWLALPPNVNGVEKVSILKSVFDTDSEFVAFSCSGNYTVDWGDGTVENFTSNTKAEHQYDYSNVNLNSGTVANYGYKQCIITITPQVGETLTKCLLNQYHTSIGSSSYSMNSGFLDINVNLPNVTSTSNFGIGAESLANSTFYVNMSDLKRVCIGQIGLTSLNYLFYNCYNIQEILFDFDTSVVTSWSNTFYQCFSLQKCPTIVFNPSGITDTLNMFAGCYSLVEIQDINITLNSVANIGNMFIRCYSLPRLVLNITSNISLSLTGLVAYCYSLSDLTLTLSGTGKVRNLSSTFSYCYSLTKAPDLDTSSCTSFSATFSGSGIVVAPDYNYLSATTLNSCYSSCNALVYVPDITVSNACTSLDSMFISCSALTKAPNITGTTGVTSVSNMFSNCTSLTSVPAYSFPAVAGTGIAYMFEGCSSLKVVPAINVGTTFTGNSNFFRNNYALSRMLVRLKYSFSVANAKMSAEALNEMYSILPTVATSQTVTVTGNYGATNTPVVSKTCSTTTGSATILTSDTSGLSVGMVITGTGVSNSGTCTFTDATNIVTKAGHTFVNNDIIAFPTITGTTGILINTIYYVINVATDTFQLSLTQGGSAIDLVTNGSGNYISPMFVNSIVNNTSITMSAPAIATNASVSISFRSGTHKTYLATMKKWTVIG